MKAAKDVIPHLGKPTHFRPDRSGGALAISWFKANRLPSSIADVLSRDARLSGAELVDGFLERKVDLGDGSTASQTDLLAILGVGDHLAVMAVEGKVDESFGPFVADWLKKDQKKRRSLRLNSLRKTLSLLDSDVGDLRYQLLHRTASALYEAHRYRAPVAIMMVHSFCPSSTGLADYQAFAARLGLNGANKGELAGPVQRLGIDLYLGWAPDKLNLG